MTVWQRPVPLIGDDEDAVGLGSGADPAVTPALTILGVCYRPGAQ